MKLYFIAGASGSGKTAIIEPLKSRLGNSMMVYDFDDIGVPSNADTRWRQQATEQWLNRLISENRDACLLGQMVFGEILACPAANQLDQIYFFLLDVNDYERCARLQQSSAVNCTQDTLNWAAWLRLHHQNPQWMQQVIKNNCWETLNFSRWERQTDWRAMATVKLLDTTTLSIANVATTITNFIENQQNKNSVIFLNGASSSGKSSLAKQLQQRLETPYLHIGLDNIIEMMPEKMNDWNKHNSNEIMPGFFWQQLTDENSKPLTAIQLGPFAKRLSDLCRAIVITMLNLGHNLIIDEVCLTKENFDCWQKLLAPYPTLYIALQANTQTLEAREKNRDDRITGSARHQNLTIHRDKTYDLILDTSLLSTEACVDEIIQSLNKPYES